MLGSLTATLFSGLTLGCRLKEAGPQAYAAVTKAMTLSPSIWEVNFSRAFYACWLGRPWRDAEPYFPEGYLYQSPVIACTGVLRLVPGNRRTRGKRP